MRAAAQQLRFRLLLPLGQAQLPRSRIKVCSAPMPSDYARQGRYPMDNNGIDRTPTCI